MKRVLFDSDVLLDILMERQPFVTAAVIDAALKSAMLDFEDAVTSIAAEASGAEVIVTRNASDFLRARVPTLSPGEFLDEKEDSP